RLYAVKGRGEEQPTALVAADVERLVAELPELPAEALSWRRGPVTLVVPNPARRFQWLTGANPDAIGVRVPSLPEPTSRVVTEVGMVVADRADTPGRARP